MYRSSRAAFNATEPPRACPHCGLAELCRLARRLEAQGHGHRGVARLRGFGRGEYVFRTGDAFHSLYAVCFGAVKTCAVSADGDVQLDGLYVAGEMLGMEALAERRCHADAIAVGPVRICEMPLARVEALGAEAAEWRRALWTTLALELRRGHERLHALLGKTGAAARLAAFLLDLRQRQAPRGEGPAEFALHLSQIEVAAYLGLAKETVCRLFARFERQGWLRLRGGRACIEDREALARVAGMGAAHGAGN